MPAVASTDSANPAVVASPGSSSSSTTTATPRPRTPRCSPPPTQPDQGHRAHGCRAQHAGLGAGQQHEPDDPERRRPAPASDRAPRPSGPPRAGTRRPGSGWCPTPPSGGSARSSGSRHAGARACRRRRRRRGRAPARAGRPAGGPRTPGSAARSASVARQAGPGSPIRSGGPRGVAAAATSSLAGPRRPVNRTVSPIRTSLPAGPSEHQDRVAHSRDRAVGFDRLRDAHPHQHAVTEPARDDPRVRGHLALQHDECSCLRQPGDRAVPHRVGPGQRHRSHRSRDQHHRGRRQRDRPHPDPPAARQQAPDHPDDREDQHREADVRVEVSRRQRTEPGREPQQRHPHVGRPDRRGRSQGSASSRLTA